MVFIENLVSMKIRLLNSTEILILRNVQSVKDNICVILESEMLSKFMITKQVENVMILIVKEI
jgi:hypothetical protein